MKRAPKPVISTFLEDQNLSCLRHCLLTRNQSRTSLTLQRLTWFLKKGPPPTVGAQVHAKATWQSVADLWCIREVKKVNGTVLEIVADKLNGRPATSLGIKLDLVHLPTRKTKVETIKIISMKAGNVPEQVRVALKVGPVRRSEEDEVVT